MISSPIRMRINKYKHKLESPKRSRDIDLQLQEKTTIRKKLNIDNLNSPSRQADRHARRAGQIPKQSEDKARASSISGSSVMCNSARPVPYQKEEDELSRVFRIMENKKKNINKNEEDIIEEQTAENKDELENELKEENEENRKEKEEEKIEIKENKDWRFLMEKQSSSSSQQKTPKNTKKYKNRKSQK